MQGRSTSTYEFGRFRLDVTERRLLCDGQALPLTPKVFDVLQVLVENSGHLVEKDKLLADVWPNSFVEDGALSRSISILRKTLAEGDPELAYIETLPTRGYRFVAPVTTSVVDGSETLVQPAAVETLRARPSRTGVAAWLAGAAGTLLVIALAHAMLARNGRETHAAGTSAPLHRQVTFTGKERAAAISPNGQRIAYVSYEKPDKKLIVQELAGGPPLAIFEAPEIGYLRWSPDGTELLAWARGSGKNGIYILPLLGGTPRRIAERQYVACWSPDGTMVAVASYLSGKIWFFSTSGGQPRTVSLRGVKGAIWDIDWSARDLLTFVSDDEKGQYTVWTVKPDGSEQRRLVVAGSEIPAARWGSRGDVIFYLRRVNQTFTLFRLPIANERDAQDGAAAPVMAGLESDRFFSLSADGQRLVYARAPYYSNLWLVDANGDDPEKPEMHELTHGTSLIERPSLSPDGRSIVFNIGYEPVTNLYRMPITGDAPKQITFFNSFNLGAAWSADGSRIAFASIEGGQSRIRVVDADGGESRAFPAAGVSDTFDVTWSPGPRILYQQSGNQNYYELDPETRSERLLFNDRQAGWIFSPAYSPDGRRIAVLWSGRPSRGIWVIDTTDHREALVYATLAAWVMPVRWSADGGSIYVLEGTNLNFRGLTSPHGETLTNARIMRVHASGGRPRTVAMLPFDEIGGVSMTPDGRRFVCAVYSSRSDVWVVDNFDGSR